MGIANNRGKKEVLEAYWLANTFKVLLASDSYVPNADHNFVSQVTNELSGVGYQSGFSGTGRQVLSGKTVTQDDANDRAEATATANIWLAINAGILRYAVVYRPVTSDADSPIIATIVLTLFTTVGEDISVNWQVAASGGIYYI